MGYEKPNSPVGSDGSKKTLLKALSEIITTVKYLEWEVGEGRISDQVSALLAKAKILEIFRKAGCPGFIDNVSDEEARLLGRLSAQHDEIRNLHIALHMKDPKVKALADEVERMLESGKPPEMYAERPNKSEKSLEFLKRIYGKYLEPEKEVIFLFQIRKLDPKFVRLLSVICNRDGIDLGTLVPRKSARTDRVVISLGDEAKRTGNAVCALRMRMLKIKRGTGVIR